MTRMVGIVSGVSGVGKTWLLEKVGATVPMKILSASALIRDGIAQREGEITSQDHLRYRDINDNQTALLEAFKRNIEPDNNLVILDAHFVIDSHHGLVDVELDVFREIEPRFVVFVEDEPSKIFSKRKRDASRLRPERSIDYISKLQEVSIAAARHISHSLSIPIYFVNAGDTDGLARILSAAQKADSDV